MIEEYWIEFLECPAQKREQQYSRRHGRIVLEVTGEMQLENLRLLNQNTKRRIATNEFSEFLANDLGARYSLPSLSISTLQSFLAFLYLRDMNPYSSILMDIVTLTSVSEFFSDEQVTSMKNAKLSQEAYQEGKIQHKSSCEQSQKQKEDSRCQIHSQQLEQEMTRNQGQNNLEKNSDPKGEVTELDQIDSWMKLRNFKKERFQQMLKESEKLGDPISAITHLKDKNPLISFESSISYSQGSTFICTYTSTSLGISEVRSDAKPRKKEAQSNAAKKFYPHLLFYIEFKMPYLENDDDEFYYQKNKSDPQKSQNPGQDETNSADEEQEDFDLLFDLDLMEANSDSITQVYYYIQRHENNNGVDNIKKTYTEKRGIFSCIVRFIQQGKEIFSCTGRGRSKKQAKEVAFHKLCPLINEFYNPESEQRVIPEQPKVYQRRAPRVECEAPESGY